MFKTVSVPYRYEKERVIYQSASWRTVARMNRRRLFWGIIFCLLAALIFLSFLAPILLSEKNYRGQKSKIHSGFGELLWLEQKGIVSPADWQFSLIIPEIDLNARVVAEVDASDEAAYREALKRGLAHAQGSSYPGKQGLLYIFGHSTDFVWNVSNINALFYLLGKLEKGDEVDIVYQGRHYAYQVTEKEIVSAGDLARLKETEERQLVLSTCWPPGTTWQRLIVTALPQEDQNQMTTFDEIL